MFQTIVKFKLDGKLEGEGLLLSSATHLTKKIMYRYVELLLPVKDHKIGEVILVSDDEITYIGKPENPLTYYNDIKTKQLLSAVNFLYTENLKSINDNHAIEFTKEELQNISEQLQNLFDLDYSFPLSEYINMEAFSSLYEKIKKNKNGY
jgi:hypothetical protein